ncbi:MAG: hypothetical protein ABR875_03870 [Minisyncoccia bacterium]
MKKEKIEKFRAENFHLINHEQVKKIVRFWSSNKYAKDKFRQMRKDDPTIQEAALYREKNNELVDEYIGYV